MPLSVRAPRKGAGLALGGLTAALFFSACGSPLMVDYTNHLRREGLSRYEALCQAGPTRLRPILMTSMALILAMLPLESGYRFGSRAPPTTDGQPSLSIESLASA